MIDKIYTAIHKGDFVPKVMTLPFSMIGYSNNHLQTLQVRNYNYNKLRKKYNKYIGRLERGEICSPCSEVNACNKNVWTCWLQGEEKAPVLVKACIKSMRKNINNITVISEENYEEYIKIPDIIKKKWKAGIISNAHFSDILRLELLEKYGGLWLDATVYMTGGVPKYIENSSLFLYHHTYYEDATFSFNNWLIYVRDPLNKVIKASKDSLIKYWTENNRVTDYFLWHIFTTMISKENPWAFLDIPYVSDAIPEMLANTLNEEYDQIYWDEIKAITPIHKLSTKINHIVCDKETFFDHILKE